MLFRSQYQKCKLVTYLAAALDIELLYIPPYSPHLNLIERLWKWVKKDCLYSKYYQTFEEFKQAINTSLCKIQNESKEELKTLLNLKFQTFEKTKIIAV